MFIGPFCFHTYIYKTIDIKFMNNFLSKLFFTLIYDCNFLAKRRKTNKFLCDKLKLLS